MAGRAATSSRSAALPPKLDVNHEVFGSPTSTRLATGSLFSRLSRAPELAADPRALSPCDSVLLVRRDSDLMISVAPLGPVIVSRRGVSDRKTKTRLPTENRQPGGSRVRSRGAWRSR